MEEFTLFNTLTMDDQIEEEFHKFFKKYDLQALFTNEHRAGDITVTDSDMRSIVNENGKYHELFKKFEGYLKIAQENKSYEEAMLKILYSAKTFQKLANNVRNIMNYIDNEISHDHLFNTWNIVWYNKESFK